MGQQCSDRTNYKIFPGTVAMLVFLFTGHIVQHSALILCISADNSKAVHGPNSSVTKHAITCTFPPVSYTHLRAHETG